MNGDVDGALDLHLLKGRGGDHLMASESPFPPPGGQRSHVLS